MAYPDTELRADRLDALGGGQPASAFGQPALKFVWTVLDFLSRAFLTYQRVPYSTVVAVCATGASAGDVALVDLEQVTTDGSPYVAAGAGLTAPAVLGVYLEAVSAGARARIAVAGLVPPAVTGLSPRGATCDAGLDVSSGRVRPAQAGDPVVGQIDRQGQLLFTGHGLVV